jgi:flagellar FliL protein
MLEVMLADYHKSWSGVYPLQFDYERSEMQTQFVNIATPTEIVVVSSFNLELGSGGGAWWFVGRAAPGHDAPKPAEVKPPLFHTLEPFTVNLAEENGDHYLQMSVVYQVADEKAVEKVKTYLPVIRNRILLLLSTKRPSDLGNAQGKEKLVQELLTAARESIPGSVPDRGIVGAYLGAFVIQ